MHIFVPSTSALGHRGRRCVAGALALLLGAWISGAEVTERLHPQSDEYQVRIPSLGNGTAPRSGRLILFFIDDSARKLRGERPIDGPHWTPPQPIASMEVTDVTPGTTIRFRVTDRASFPKSLDALSGIFRVQALFDCDSLNRAHAEAPGNLYSDVMRVELDPARREAIALTLDHVVAERVDPPPPDLRLPNIRWVRLRSERLSAFHDRTVEHRAGIALPAGFDDPRLADYRWPVIFEIPGYGGRDDGAIDWAHTLLIPRVDEIAPYAVYVVLDPESPLGHHGFCDSANNGPVGTALVEELIPFLTSEFRLTDRNEGRLVMGHSSGGWSSLWLQLEHPESFGGCWSSAPDPVDFSAFETSDLYADANLYFGPDGSLRGSFRELATVEGLMRMTMSAREENAMEHAIDPHGRSGQQWDAWEAMFSPRDPATGLPTPMFDPLSGRIDRSVVEHWARFDIARRLSDDWDRRWPIMRDRVRLNVGGIDSFYLERAVAALSQKMERRLAGDAWSGAGYVRIIPDETHSTVARKIADRVNHEMRAHLIGAGFRSGPPTE